MSTTILTAIAVADIVAFIRDIEKNVARVAVMGDTRVMVLNADKTGLEKDPLFYRWCEIWGAYSE